MYKLYSYRRRFDKRRGKKRSPKPNGKTIDQLIETLNRDKVPKELKKFFVYMAEMQLYGPNVSKEFVIFCLSSYFILNGHAYELIVKKFPNLLKREFLENVVLKGIVFSPGIQDVVLELIRIKTENQAHFKNCILIVDETVLKPELYYSEKHDIIIGYEDNGLLRTPKPARFVTNIWLKSTISGQTIPLAYYFTFKSVTAPVLKEYIFKAIEKFKSINIDVYAVVTKLRSNFHALAQLLNVSITNQKFTACDREILFIFDVPHLLNITRNNFMKYKFQFDGKEAAWKHVENLYSQEILLGERKTNLTQKHMNPDNNMKTLPLLAAQVLSNSVATELRALVSRDLLPNSATGTADCVDLFDKLFDVLNSSKIICINNYNSAYKGTTMQVEFLQKVITFFTNLRLRDEEQDRTQKVKFIEAWLISIKAIMQLWDVLKVENQPHLLTRYLCCEPLDNFVKMLRWQIVRIRDPTPLGFVRLYKTGFILKYFYTDGPEQHIDWVSFSKDIYKRIPKTKHDLNRTENKAKN